MKRIFLMIGLAALLAIGVLHEIPEAIAKDKTAWQEWKSHPSHFLNWEHMKFSMWGHKAPMLKDAQRSRDEHWWGKTIAVKK